MKAKRRLDRAKLRGLCHHHQIGCEGKLEPAAYTNSVHAGDDRDRQGLECPKQPHEVPVGNPSQIHRRTECIEIRAGREMTQPAAQDDGARTDLAHPLQTGEQLFDKPLRQQVVRRALHGENRNVTVALATDKLSHATLRTPITNHRLAGLRRQL
jgi:hypothetical protein